jgi:hypothetical protein
MLFPGPKLNTVFASRWKALLWAGGVLVTAYCTVPAADDVSGKAGDQQAKHVAKATHKNPWAVDPATQNH